MYIPAISRAEMFMKGDDCIHEIKSGADLVCFDYVDRDIEERARYKSIATLLGIEDSLLVVENFVFGLSVLIIISLTLVDNEALQRSILLQYLSWRSIRIRKKTRAPVHL